MQKVLFIDRDGTLIKEPEIDQQVDSLEKLEFMPGVFRYLSRIAEETDYRLVMVTNQDGLGSSSFPEASFWPAHNKMIQALANESIYFDDVFIDRTFKEDNQATRKPGTAMLLKYIHGPYDIENSYVIGDRLSDVELAKNLKCKSIYFSEEQINDASISSNSWAEIYRYLASEERVAKLTRTTNETKINLDINLDNNSDSSIYTGLKFFDHMLEQISRHGGIGIKLEVKGDLEVDEHHTVEDTALALGGAFSSALGSKKGIERYAFVLPMDDSLAQVAIDFGGRPWLNWNVKFSRERIGDVPTEMFFHFFKSFSDAAKCNIDIKCEGDNEHHMIESVFKAFARTLKAAVRHTGDFKIPSTKGIL